MIRRGCVEWLPVGDFQFHTAVNGFAFQAIQADNFFVATAFAEMFSGNSPEGIALFHGAGAAGFEEFDWFNRSVFTAQRNRYHAGQIAHSGIKPAFVGKPSVDVQYHLVRFWGVVQRFRLIPKPEQLRFAVAPADIGAKLKEPLVDTSLVSAVQPCSNAFRQLAASLLCSVLVANFASSFRLSIRQVDCCVIIQRSILIYL